MFYVTAENPDFLTSFGLAIESALETLKFYADRATTQSVLTYLRALVRASMFR